MEEDPELSNLDVPFAVEEFTITGDAGPLFAALAAAQLEFGSIAKDQQGQIEKGAKPYSYADLAGTIEATRSALNKQGIALLQPFTIQRGKCTVRTIIAHGTGATITAVSTFNAEQEGRMSSWQNLGSAITYCRRYSYQAILGVAPALDDDGASAPPVASQRRQEPPSPKPAPKAVKPIPEPPKQSVAHDSDGVVGEDSPEAIAAAEEVEAPPVGEDASYQTDDVVRRALNAAIKRARWTDNVTKRHVHKTYNIAPNQLGKMTVRIAKEVTAFLDALPPCQCPPQAPYCTEKTRTP